MTNSAKDNPDPRVLYADIIDLPHWDSPAHPRMSLRDRAAQFAPFSALTGYGDAIKESVRLNESLYEENEEEEWGDTTFIAKNDDITD